MIDVKCEVATYDDGGEKRVLDRVEVCSHWNEERMVLLKVGTFTAKVSASDLIAAIRNCTQTNRFT